MIHLKKSIKLLVLFCKTVKMKFSILIIVLVAAALGYGFPALENRNLRNDLLEFLDLLPKQEMLSISMEHYKNDKDVQEAVNFITSDEFHQFILGLENIQDIQAILKYFQTQGIDVYGLANNLHMFLGMSSYIPPPNYLRSGKQKCSRSLYEELTSLLPKEKIEELKQQKLDTSVDYRSFYHISTSDVYKDLHCNTIEDPEFQRFLDQAEAHNLHPLKIYEFVRSIFGIENIKC